MQTESKLIFVIFLLIISLIFNLYFGVTSYVKYSYTPNLDDQVILGEMTKMVLQNEQYQEIASRETVYSIKQGVSRFNVSNPSSVIFYEISVQTEKQDYIFTCTDVSCTDVSIGGWSGSRYSEEEPVLPLNKNKWFIFVKQSGCDCAIKKLCRFSNRARLFEFVTYFTYPGLIILGGIEWKRIEKDLT